MSIGSTFCVGAAQAATVKVARGSFAKIVTKISMSYPLRLFLSTARVCGAHKHAVKTPVGFLREGFSPESENDRELRVHHFWGRGTFLGGPDSSRVNRRLFEMRDIFTKDNRQKPTQSLSEAV